MAAAMPRLIVGRRTFPVAPNNAQQPPEQGKRAKHPYPENCQYKPFACCHRKYLLVKQRLAGTQDIGHGVGKVRDIVGIQAWNADPARINNVHAMPLAQCEQLLDR